MASTEPQSDSDFSLISTTTELSADEWALNGKKIFVTCADRCDTEVVWATLNIRTDKVGVTVFFIER